MNPPAVVPLVVSCLLAAFIHSSLISKATDDIKGVEEARRAAQSSHQLSPSVASTSGTSRSNAESAADLNRFADKQPRTTRETSSSLPQRTSTGVNPAARPASVEPVAGPSSAVPKNKFENLPRSYTGFFNRFMASLGIRQKSYKQVRGTFSAKFDDKSMEYTEVTLGRNAPSYHRLSKDGLLAAHKEIEVLSEFYNRINKATNSLKKAEIFEASMNTLKGLPVEKLTPSGYEAWLQTFAAIMEVGKRGYAPDVRMEAIAQHGLLDLATKFDNGVRTGTHAYFTSTEDLQKFLMYRFALKRRDPGLEAEAQKIPWASPVLYYSRPINFDSDLARYKEWLTTDETPAITKTLKKMKRAGPDAPTAQQEVLEDLKAQADMANKQTSSKEKSAASIVLSMLGCAPGKNAELFGQTSENLQQQARKAIKDLISPEDLGLSRPNRRYTVYPNNAQTMREFEKIYYNGAAHDPKNFRVVTLRDEDGDLPGIKFNKMNYDVLQDAMLTDPELSKYVKTVFWHHNIPKETEMKRFMDHLMKTPTEQIEVENFEMYIHAFAHTMGVDQRNPLDVKIETVAQFGLLDLMTKFSPREHGQNAKLYDSSKVLQVYLAKRLDLYGHTLVNEAEGHPWATEALFPSRSIPLKSNVKKYEEWFALDKTMENIFEKLKNDNIQLQEKKDLVTKLETMATIQDKSTSAEQKTASLMLLTDIGYAKELESSLQEIDGGVKDLALAALGRIQEPGANLLLPNNAARAKMIPWLATHS